MRRYNRLYAGDLSVLFILCYLENQHSDRQPEHHRHVCVFLRAVERHSRGGRHSDVTRQRLRSVPLSHLAHKTSAVVSSGDLDIRNSSHGVGTLRCRRPSHLVQGKNSEP